MHPFVTWTQRKLLFVRGICQPPLPADGQRPGLATVLPAYADMGVTLPHAVALPPPHGCVIVCRAGTVDVNASTDGHGSHRELPGGSGAQILPGSWKLPLTTGALPAGLGAPLVPMPS